MGSLRECRERMIDDRFAVEDLCHDRLAAGLRAGACGGDQRHAEAAEPVHFESDFHCAEGCGGGL